MKTLVNRRLIFIPTIVYLNSRTQKKANLIADHYSEQLFCQRLLKLLSKSNREIRVSCSSML